MHKIKRQMVEELLQAEELHQEEFVKDRTSQEYKNTLEILFHLHAKITVENDDEKNKMAWLVIEITEAIARAKLSLSRLLKCLEVCGIEVVE